MKIIEINENNFESVVLKGNKVLVDFNANWCGPCRMLKRVLESYGDETDTIIASLNVDDNEKIASQYNIYSIPCLILFLNGKEIKRNVGFINESELKEFLDE